MFLSFSILLRCSPLVFVFTSTCCGFTVKLYRQNYDLLSCYSIGRHKYIITVAAIYTGVK
jgi:hypothetical protein